MRTLTLQFGRGCEPRRTSPGTDADVENVGTFNLAAVVNRGERCRGGAKCRATASLQFGRGCEPRRTHHPPRPPAPSAAFNLAAVVNRGERRRSRRSPSNRPPFNLAAVVNRGEPNAVGDLLYWDNSALQFGRGCEPRRTGMKKVWAANGGPLQFGRGCEPRRTWRLLSVLSAVCHTLQFGRGCEPRRTPPTRRAVGGPAGPSIWPRL